MEAFVAPVVATAATLGGTVLDPDRPDLWAPRARRRGGWRAAEEGEAEGVSAPAGRRGGGTFRRNLRRGGGRFRRKRAARHDPPRVRTPTAEHDPSAPWRAPVALVIAHYDEWDDLDEMPVWANNSKDPRVHPDAPTARGYTVAPMYQRRRPEAPGYVPNHGYEGGVYLRFVLDHYDNLPDVAVFVQADADAIGDVASRLGKVVTRQKERGDVGYLRSTSAGMETSSRCTSTSATRTRSGGRRRRCGTSTNAGARWRGGGGTSGRPRRCPPSRGTAATTSRRRARGIREAPLATWRKAYEALIERGECSPGAGPVATRTDDKGRSPSRSSTWRTSCSGGTSRTTPGTAARLGWVRPTKTKTKTKTRFWTRR